MGAEGREEKKRYLHQLHGKEIAEKTGGDKGSEELEKLVEGIKRDLSPAQRRDIRSRRVGEFLIMYAGFPALWEKKSRKTNDLRALRGGKTALSSVAKRKRPLARVRKEGAELVAQRKVLDCPVLRRTQRFPPREYRRRRGDSPMRSGELCRRRGPSSTESKTFGLAAPFGKSLCKRRGRE